MQNPYLIADQLIAQAPFPSITEDGVLRDGLVINQPPVCHSCKDRPCREAYKRSEVWLPDVCYRGMGIALTRISTRPVLFNGLVLKSAAPKLPRRMKKTMEEFRVDIKRVQVWQSITDRLATSIGEFIDTKVSDSLGMLHDVQTSASLILRNAEAFVDRQPGDTVDDKMDSLDRVSLALVKSAHLLEARLAMMPLLTNPESAKYGHKKPAPIYRIVDRLVRMMRSYSHQSGVDIRISGASYRTPVIYPSFETIPLVLLENAVKYSLTDQAVQVDVNDNGRDVYVRVQSFSPYIPPPDRKRLFEQGFRSEYAARVAKQGSGLGLYLANIVAEAHGCRINHSCDEKDVQIGGIRYCNNTFSFSMRS